ncbi:MAG: RDD family protein [Acidimicrobiia bacterium]|nr:RDD family protein [Acidimicrobiia bacterium]
MNGLGVRTGRRIVVRPGGPRARLRAQLADGVVIAGWAVVAAAVGLVVRSTGYEFGDPSTADLFAFVTLVAPVTITFALQESSPDQATFGKHRGGLQVTDRSGHRLGRGRALVRSAVKFAPWQLAHTAVFGLVAEPTSTWFAALAVGSQLVVVASFGIMAVDADHRALHDLVAGTRVVKSEPEKGEG